MSALDWLLPWDSQPQESVGVNPEHPMGQSWALVHVPGVMLFGSANPVGTLRTNTEYGVGVGGRSLIQSGSAANSGLDFGANAALLLNTLSGIGVAKCINSAGYTPFITTAFRAISPSGGFYIDIGLGKIRLIHGDVAVLLESSNAVAQGQLAKFAWSYNASTGRVRVALNGVLTTGTTTATLSHVAFNEGGYYTDNASGTTPSEHFLLAISPSEQYSDAALIWASLNPWQLFAPRSIWVPVSAGGGGTAAITQADGAATTSTLAATSTAATAITQAAGAATASTLAASSVAVAAFSQADGAATASTLASTSTAVAAITQADGVATASTLAASSIAVTALAQADGAATTSALAGSSTAAAAITQADGAATTSTMVGSDAASGNSAISPASGAATASTMAATSVAVASFSAATGAATASDLAGAATAATAITQADGVATAATMASGSSTIVSATMSPASGAATASAFAASAFAASVCIAAAGAASAQTMAATSQAVAAISAAAGVATCSTLVDANGVDTNSAWWTYTVEADNLTFTVAADDLTYTIGV